MENFAQNARHRSRSWWNSTGTTKTHSAISAVVRLSGAWPSLFGLLTRTSLELGSICAGNGPSRSCWRKQHEKPRRHPNNHVPLPRLPDLLEPRIRGDQFQCLLSRCHFSSITYRFQEIPIRWRSPLVRLNLWADTMSIQFLCASAAAASGALLQFCVMVGRWDGVAGRRCQRCILRTQSLSALNNSTAPSLATAADRHRDHLASQGMTRGQIGDRLDVSRGAIRLPNANVYYLVSPN